MHASSSQRRRAPAATGGTAFRSIAPAHVVPMGAWVDRVPTTPPDGFDRRRAVFLGHLVARQGVGTLLDALALLDDVAADVIGTGPLEQELRETRADRDVTFHGYVEDHREVERLLGRSLRRRRAVRSETFTRYADPGKLKAYLAAGLPIVLTEVPPNARELEREAGAEVVAADPRRARRRDRARARLARAVAGAARRRARLRAALRLEHAARRPVRGAQRDLRKPAHEADQIGSLAAHHCRRLEHADGHRAEAQRGVEPAQ